MAAVKERMENERVGMIGLGPRTGVSMVRYLCARGAKVYAYDKRPKGELADTLDELSEFEFEGDFGSSSPRRLFEMQQIIVSPGVPFNASFLVQARERGIPVLSEVEFAARRLTDPLLVVTGTNGKSTTTSLLAHLLGAWGKKVFAGGNLGRPLVEALDDEYDFVVAEVSSFQLEGVVEFHPKVAVLLNVSPNHLDRHVDMATYTAMKARVFQRMVEGDCAVLNLDDPICVSMAQDKKAEVRTFSVSGKKAATVRIEHGRAWAQNGQSISLQTFTLFGRHNLENLIAAVTAALFVHCPVSVIERAMGDFQALPHRLQLVGTCHGVRFVNDSKSTTPASSEKAVEAFSTPVILVAGGRPKGASFQGLAQTSKGRVKYAVFFGEAAEEMTQAFNEIPHQKVETLREAFDSALSKASEGDVLLFSPANASFDQFKNYEDRGEKFVSLVHAYMKAAS